MNKRNNLKYIWGSPLLYLVALPLMGDFGSCSRTSKPKGSTKSSATEKKPTLSPEEEEEEEADKDLAQDAADNKPADPVEPQEQVKKEEEEDEEDWGGATVFQKEDTSWLKDDLKGKEAEIEWLEREEEAITLHMNYMSQLGDIVINNAFKNCQAKKQTYSIFTSKLSKLKKIDIDNIGKKKKEIIICKNKLNLLIENIKNIKVFLNNRIGHWKNTDGKRKGLFISSPVSKHEKAVAYEDNLRKNISGGSIQQRKVVTNLDNAATTKVTLLNSYKNLLEGLSGKVIPLIELFSELATSYIDYTDRVLGIREEYSKIKKGSKKNKKRTEQKIRWVGLYENCNKQYKQERDDLVADINRYLGLCDDTSVDLSWDVIKEVQEAQIARIDSIHEHWKTIQEKLQKVHRILSEKV